MKSACVDLLLCSGTRVVYVVAFQIFDSVYSNIDFLLCLSVSRILLLPSDYQGIYNFDHAKIYPQAKFCCSHGVTSCTRGIPLQIMLPMNTYV